MPEPGLKSKSGLPEEPEPVLRLCSLTESETGRKYDQNDCRVPAAAVADKGEEMAAALADSRPPWSGHEPGENIYDEPTASAPLLDTSGLQPKENIYNNIVRKRRLAPLGPASGAITNHTTDLKAADWWVQTNHSDDGEEEDGDGGTDGHDRTVEVKKDDDFQRPAKLDLLVGILRLVNFLSACTSVFGIVVSLYFPLSEDVEKVRTVWFQLRSDQRKTLGNYDWIFVVKEIAGVIQLIYLLIAAAFIIVDSVATLTFRWKEYGELTHRHTDATSVLFLVSKSRWKMRLLACLTICSSLSLHTTQIILSFFGRTLEDKREATSDLVLPDEVPQLAFHAVVWYIALMLSCVPALILGYLLHLIPAKWRDVPWLDDCITQEHIDDQGDQWKSSREIALYEVQHISKLVESTVPNYFAKKAEQEENFYEAKYKTLTCFGQIIETINKGVYFVCYVCAIAMNLQALLMMELSFISFEFWTVLFSGSATTLISLYLVVLVCILCFKLPPKSSPLLLRIYVPFVLSAGIRLLLDLCRHYKEQQVFVIIYIVLLLLFFTFQAVALLGKRCSFERTIDYCFCRFITFNFITAEGAYKKVVRLFDSIGSFFALVGLVVGLCSVCSDQYDLDFEPQGDLKTLVDGFKEFSSGIESVQEYLKGIIKKFDYSVTCEHIYTSIASGSLAAIFLSLVPGASSAAAIGSKTAIYSVKIGSALSRLAGILKSSAKKLWEMAKVVKTITKFTFGAFKKFTIGSSSMALLRLLPFLPPVVVGIFVLYSAFWPQRILFFSAKQRRKFINGQFLQWLLVLVLLILALCINMALVDELVRVFDDAIPLVKVHLLKKLGWKLSLAASAFSIAAALAFFVAYLVLKIRTDRNHDNLTNEELDWKHQLEKRNLVSFNTPFGQKIEKRNQIRYKKERIGPWTWVLPILLCLLACGFAILANLYPKIDMYREPKGALGRTLDKIVTKISFYEDDMRRVREYGEMECLPFQTFGDVLSDSLQRKSNILMNPINAFFNKTEEIFTPLKQVVARARRQLVADIGDDLFGQDVLNNIEKFQLLDLRYIGMLLLIPRVLNLLILIFGLLTMSVATCRMIICEAVEPKKIVDAFGTVTVFSVVFVLGAQLALFNILEDVGIPFYRISVRLGLGFFYDLACDSIMISILIGMKNEFFFAIPKRKVTVTYEVPGASDGGPNIRGQII